MKIKQKESESVQRNELGIRKVSKMNFSYIVTLPKEFVKDAQNGQTIMFVKLTLLEDRSLKITPICMKDEPTDFSVM